MKACEKYLKEFYKNHKGNYHYDPNFRQGWKAALERVLNTLIPEAAKQEEDLVYLKNKIEEELNETSNQN